MIKRALNTAYEFFPFSFKTYLRDLYFYVRSSFNGAKNIKSIQFIKEHSEVCVLGNGPSLKKDKAVIKKIMHKQDFVCVNNFCDDELYTTLKPKLYVFLDGYFFSEKAHPDWVTRRNKTFGTIDKSTTWPMKIIVPQSAKTSILSDAIKNHNIEIIKVNTQNLYTKRYNRLIGRLFDTGLYGPPQINVLIYGVYLSVLANYKKVHVFGADLSFHNDINVDQSTNDLYMVFRHFNEKDKIEPLRKNPAKIEKWTMGEVLDLSANTFYAHETLYSYAASKGVKIYNCSDFSLIDAYPRKTFTCH